MKKLLSLIICFTLLNVFCLNTVAENTSSVQGLDECLDKICLNSDINKETRENALSTYQVYLEKLIPQIMENPDYAKKKMGIEIGTYEEEIEQIRQMFALDTNTGLLVSGSKTLRYWKQYAERDNLHYLFTGKNIFTVNGNFYGGGYFDAKGDYINFDEIELDFGYGSFVVVDEDIYSYLNDRKKLKNELLTEKEVKVNNINIFALGNLTFLYIEGEKDEYLVKMRGERDNIIPSINAFTVYKADELLTEFTKDEVKNSVYSYTLSEAITKTKPTYETEAQSLYTDGLLKGNENGLDLLKPLTRIEATAILVRAMGFENEQTSENSYFSDIASDNWGAKYANIAKDKGISEGIGNNMFAPDDTITASQFVTLILRNLGESPDWQTAVNLFVERGLITQEQADKMDLFTRGDMAKIIYEARRNGMFKS